MAALVRRVSAISGFGGGEFLPSGRRLFALLGPGYVVAVGYMDPGNWATDLAAGARYGFALLSVVLIAGVVGAVLQAQAVRLTLATGQDLAGLIRARFPRPVALGLWAVAELAVIATDLAELLGSAVALKLLLGLPLAAGVLVSAALTFALLALPGGRASPEGVIGALVAVVAVAFAWQLAMARPDLGVVLAGYVPSAGIVRDPEMLYLSLGILGATVMPHNLFLHSGLTRRRLLATRNPDRSALARDLTRDSWRALGLAIAVNSAILILAATALRAAPGAAVPGIEDAYRLLDPALGSDLAGVLFAVALLAAGQSATATGTMAGQMVTEGFLGLRLAPMLRALVTRGAALVPALGFLLMHRNGAVDDLLILSQVVLALALPFVLLPMFLLLRDARLMGRLALPAPALRLLAMLVVTMIGLNGWLAGQSLL
jgi:manganese transport protein